MRGRDTRRKSCVLRGAGVLISLAAGPSPASLCRREAVADVRRIRQAAELSAGQVTFQRVGDSENGARNRRSC
jgi:hypothetical protein